MKQKLYFFMDESGLLTVNDPYFVYGGIWFTSQTEKNNFKRKYKSIIKDIKCKYCSVFIDMGLCLHVCPEIKSISLSNSDRRRILNLIKSNSNTFAVINDNGNTFNELLTNKSSRGRYRDYLIKRIVKRVCEHELRQDTIKANKHTHLVIQLDQHTTISNGYYNLNDSIHEELKIGVINYSYGTKFTPIFSADLTLDITHQDSKNNTCIQAADILVGTLRRWSISENIKLINDSTNCRLYLPWKNTL